MIFCHSLCVSFDPLVPPLRKIFIELLCWNKIMSLHLRQITKRGNHINWVSYHNNHFLCTKLLSYIPCHRIMCLRYPNCVMIAYLILPKLAHHRLHCGPLHIHISTCIHSSNVFQKSPKEGIATPWEWLKCNHILKHVLWLIQKPIPFRVNPVQLILSTQILTQ